MYLNSCKMGRAVNNTMILSIQMIWYSTHILSSVLKLAQTSQLFYDYLIYLKLVWQYTSFRYILLQTWQIHLATISHKYVICHTTVIAKPNTQGAPKYEMDIMILHYAMYPAAVTIYLYSTSLLCYYFSTYLLWRLWWIVFFYQQLHAFLTDFCFHKYYLLFITVTIYILIQITSPFEFQQIEHDSLIETVPKVSDSDGKIFLSYNYTV